MASPRWWPCTPQATAAKKLLKENNQPQEKNFNSFPSSHGCNWRKKRKTTIYLCNIHRMHSMPCAKKRTINLHKKQKKKMASPGWWPLSKHHIPCCRSNKKRKNKQPVKKQKTTIDRFLQWVFDKNKNRNNNNSQHVQHWGQFCNGCHSNDWQWGWDLGGHRARQGGEVHEVISHHAVVCGKYHFSTHQLVGNLHGNILTGFSVPDLLHAIFFCTLFIYLAIGNMYSNHVSNNISCTVHKNKYPFLEIKPIFQILIFKKIWIPLNKGYMKFFLFKHCATEKKYFVNLMMTKKYDALVQTCF